MAINKVIYGNDTLIDLTSDTVSANNLLAGETAHDRSGTAVQGNVVIPDDYAFYITLGKTDDLNNVQDSGFYIGPSGNTISNKPSGIGQFGLEVVKTATTSSGYFRQTLWKPQGDAIYTRYCSAGTWSSWTQIVDMTASDKTKLDGIESGAQVNDHLVTQTETSDTSVRSIAIANSNSTSSETSGLNKFESLNMQITDLPSVNTNGEVVLSIGDNKALDTGDHYSGYINLYSINGSKTIIGTSTGIYGHTYQVWIPARSGIVSLRQDIPTDYVNYEEQNFSGSKNLIPYPYVDGSSVTTENVTYTNSEEGWIYLNSTLTASGTANYVLANPTFIMSKIKGNKYYTFSLERDDDNIYGLVYFSNANGSNVSYEYDAVYDDGTLRVTTSTYISLNFENKLHSKVKFRIHSDDEFYVKITLRVGTGTGPYNNKKVRAMLRIGDNNDDTWAPWAMTNYQLTNLLERSVPSTAGNYKLRATRGSNGSLSFSWVADT